MRKRAKVSGLIVIMLLCLMLIGNVASKSESEENNLYRYKNSSIFIDFAQHSAATTGDFVF